MHKLLLVKREFSHFGGAEKYLDTLLSAFEGHELHLFSRKWHSDLKAQWHRARVLSFGSLCKTISFERSFRKFLSNRFDCILSFERLRGADIYRASDGCHATWLELRKEYASHLKRLSLLVNPLHRYLLSLEKEVLTSTPLVVTNSHMVAKEIEEHFSRKATVIYNGVDLIRFRPSPLLSSSPLRILFVGSGFERKGLKTALETCALLKGIPWQLHVAGKGDIRPYEALALSLGIREQVHFLGPVHHVETLYREASLFFLPTLYDPFSNATLEAMATGLPVITSTTNGASELISIGENGYALDPFSPVKRWAEAIMAIFPRLQEAGRKARITAEQFPIHHAVEAFKKVIEAICNQKSASPQPQTYK